MSKKEITIEIFEPDKTPIRSNATITNSLNVTKDYIGLNNQGNSININLGNTCYLNSLLQALFMTPEFRVKIFHWIYNEEKHGIQRDSIPFQIKKLFARMQLKLRGSEETKDLTRSKLNIISKVFSGIKRKYMSNMIFKSYVEFCSMQLNLVYLRKKKIL